MARRTRSSTPPTAIELPELALHLGDELEPGADYEAVAFDELDLADHDGAGASFRECRMALCGLDGTRLRRSSWSTCVLRDIHGVTIDLADATWREILVTDARIGALSALGATWSDVRIRGGKIDYLVLAGARLRDVVLEGCVVGELDLGGAEVRDVAVEGGSLDVLDATEARIEGLDLRRTRLGSVRGIGGLRGATLAPEQVLQLAPLLAAHLGIRVEP